MQLPPPRRFESLDEVYAYIVDLYHFLQHPAFQSVRLIPQSDPPSEVGDGLTYSKGEVYYDSDDDKFKGYTGSWDEFGDIT